MNRNLEAPFVASARVAGRAEGVILCLCSCLPVMAFLLIAPNLPAIQRSFESEPNIAVLAPIALTIPALMIAIFSAPAGFLADRLGRRQVLIGSLVVYLTSGVAPVFLGSIGAIIAARAVVGLAEAAIVTCSTTLIGD